MVANGWQIAIFQANKTQKIKDSCGLILYYTHKGEIQEFASEFQRRFFLRCHTELDDVRFVVRRVVVLGIARGRLNIRFGHCTSCLFDNSSVKLCKHDTPFHSCRKARMMSRVWGGTAFAKRSAAMKAPVGLLSGSAVCDSRWRGVAPTSATPTRSHQNSQELQM